MNTKFLMFLFILLPHFVIASTLHFNGINQHALNEALDSMRTHNIHSNRLILIDFSLPSEKERFFVINLKKHTIENKTMVAHAINSGFRKPLEFSNKINSKKSSVGLYLTNELYIGKNGLSLKIDGLEKGINNNARVRNMVIHGSIYAEEWFYKKYGMLGRSDGCFAIPKSEYLSILPKVANKTPMFVYHQK